MTISLPRPVWLTSEQYLPCWCCHESFAYENNIWTCKQGPKWYVLDEEPDLTKPHDMSVCNGTCGNPLHNPINLVFAYSSMTGDKWGDLVMMFEEEELSKLSLEERQEKEAAEAEKNRIREEEKEKEYLSCKVAAKVRDHEIVANCLMLKIKKQTKNNEDLQSKIKQPYPCKWLYNCKGDRKSGGAKPTTTHITTECWSHSYHDPATGKLIEPRVCFMLHPGEPGWVKEWETNRHYKPELANFRNLKPLSKIQEEPKPKKINNVFAALDSDDE